MVAHGIDLAVFHNNDHVRILHGGNTLGDDQLGGAGDLFPEGLPDGSVGLGVHRGGGVVQNQDLGLFQQGTGDAKTLLLTAGNIGAALLDLMVVAIGEAFDEIVGAGQLADMDQFLISSIGVAPAEVVFDGAGEELIFLQNHGNVVTEHFQIIVTDIDAADLQRAFADIIQTGDQLHQGRFTGTGTAQDTHGCAGGDVQIHFLQSAVLCSSAVAEADIFKVDGAVGNFHDSAFGGGNQIGFLGEDLTAAAQGGASHGHHNEDHGQLHQSAENLHGVGEHGAELTGGQTDGRVVAGGHDHLGADPGDGEHAHIDTGDHDGAVQSQNLFCLCHVVGELAGDVVELLDFLLFPDEALDHPDAVDVFLYNVVHLIHHLEAPVENLKDGRGQAEQGDEQHGHDVEIDTRQLGADPSCADQCQNQHQRTADGSTDDHLEGHLQLTYIGGQTGDDGCGGEFVNVGEAEFLHTIEHIVAQVFGEAGTGLGSVNGRQTAKGQGKQGEEHQLDGLGDHHTHVLHDHTVVIQFRHDQWDDDLHGHFADHGQRRHQRGPLVFPDTPGKFSDHLLCFLLVWFVVFRMGIAAHVGDGPVEKGFEEGFLLFCEAADQLIFDVHHGLMHTVVALSALGQNIDPFAAAVLFVGTHFHEAFFLQTGKQAGNGGVA